MAGNVFGAIADKLTRYVKDKVKLRAIRREDLIEVLNTNIKLHETMESTLKALPDKDFKTWFMTIKPKLQKLPGKAPRFYEVYASRLRGKAASAERDCPLKSLRDANGDYADLLKEIIKKVDDILGSEKVDIYNTRLSTLAVLGLIRQSDRVANFTLYLYSYLVHVSNGSQSSLPKYRENYMDLHMELVRKAVCDILDKQGAYNFLRDMNDLRNHQRDIVVGATGAFDFHHFTTIQGFSVSFLDNIIGALRCLNIFGAALDAWDDYKQDKYERNKEIKEWLEQHTALLRMDLAQMDPTSPQYQKTVSIIEAYDAKIAEYDQMILEFEQEE